MLLYSKLHELKVQTMLYNMCYLLGLSYFIYY